MGSIKEGIANQAIAAGIGATSGYLTKHALNGGHGRGYAAAQAGSVLGAGFANGGVSGAAAAGTALVAAKATAVAAVATAAAPIVVGAAIIGGVGYGLYKLFEE